MLKILKNIRGHFNLQSISKPTGVHAEYSRSIQMLSLLNQTWPAASLFKRRLATITMLK